MRNHLHPHLAYTLSRGYRCSFVLSFSLLTIPCTSMVWPILSFPPEASSWVQKEHTHTHTRTHTYTHTHTHTHPPSLQALSACLGGHGTWLASRRCPSPSTWSTRPQHKVRRLRTNKALHDRSIKWEGCGQTKHCTNAAQSEKAADKQSIAQMQHKVKKLRTNKAILIVH